MRVNIAELAAAAAPLASDGDPLRKRLESWPRPIRFLGVGGLGLITDLAIFTLLIGHEPHPLLVRLVSLAAATLVTWRLNRALTFDRSGRHPADEAMRYAVVAGSAQAVSYAVFALLVVTTLGAIPSSPSWSAPPSERSFPMPASCCSPFGPGVPVGTRHDRQRLGHQRLGHRIRDSAVDSDVFVIGAGPAGLTAAYCLTKEARSVIVIERDPIYVGGISRTVDYKGFLFDIGGHRFFSKSKEVVELWQEILPDDFIARPRLSRIYYNGKFFAYPLKAFEALFKLGVFTSAACLVSYVYAKIFPVAPVRTFHDWVRNQFGERLFQIFFKTYTEKVWGMSCDDISADWAAQRIKGLDLITAVLNGLKRSLGLGTRPVARRRHGQDPDRELSISAQGSRHDVGRGGAQDQGAGWPPIDGPRAPGTRIRRRPQSLAHRGRDRARRPGKLHGAPCHKLGAAA